MWLGSLNGLRQFATRKRYAAIPFVVRFFYSLFKILPPRFVFVCLVFVQYARIGYRKVLKQAFLPIALQLLADNPSLRLASTATRWLTFAQNQVLFEIGAFVECCEEFERKSTGIQHLTSAYTWSLALFEIGRFREARQVLSIYSLNTIARYPWILHHRSLLDLIEGDEPSAIIGLKIVSDSMPHLKAPHQNLAARTPVDYRPTRIDLITGNDGRLYDAYNYVGQRVIHTGEGQLNARLFQQAMEAQKRLRKKSPPLSSNLKAFLAERRLSITDVRIFPAEWFTQIGHQAILDVELQMRALGWWSGNALFVLDPNQVANSAYLRLFESFGSVLIAGVTINPALAAEIVSLQRWFGMCFNAFEMPDGEVVPWWDAAALAMQTSSRQNKSFPLRDEFDKTLGQSEGAYVNFRQTLAKWGLKPTDWYVCLHMRDATHYGEIKGVGQTHRNSDIDHYLATIKYVTDRGGWVIKLGGPRSPKLPKLPGVFDYARSKDRSELMDLFLIRNARFFIGTTSGLTNVAVGFGVSCALVNCVTTDAQLWSARVRFALKWIRKSDGTLINQRQITTTPWRWRMFSAELLGRWDAALEQNDSDEILETVKEVEALATGNIAEYLTSFPDAEQVIENWRQHLAFAHFYGDALPGVYVARKYPAFLDGNADAPVALVQSRTATTVDPQTSAAQKRARV